MSKIPKYYLIEFLFSRFSVYRQVLRLLLQASVFALKTKSVRMKTTLAEALKLSFKIM